ncbi:uncharacterized protein LOC116413372 [Galleria mellonella]|uniref:Uncharacterized protein LOC116413372 n=1 Tax=Galleria mellonella TaxID=7137 RepID=A0A6J3C892_GALME|nr:uncharacterized protein LOC116413372 [Galleria mellonella]
MEYSDNIMKFEFEEEELIYEHPSNFIASNFNFPLVYTTKLDEMVILTKENVNSLSIENISKRIIKESKPKFISYPKQERGLYAYTNKRAYNKLVKKIERINTNKTKPVNSRDSEEYTIYQMSPEADEVHSYVINRKKRTRKPRNQSQPYYFVFADKQQKDVEVISSDEDSDDHSHIRSIFLNSNEESNDILPEDDVIIEDPNANSALPTRIKPIKNIVRFQRIQISHNSNIDFSGYEISNSYLIFTYICTDYRDIYYIDEHYTLKEHYQLNNIDPNEEFIDSSKTDCVYEIYNCCWYKRELRVRQLFQNVRDKSKLRFASVKHPCIPTDCVCCCKIKTGNNSSHIAQEFSMVIKDRIETDTCNSATRSNTSKWNRHLLNNLGITIGYTINSALRYKPKIPKRTIRIKTKKDYRQFTLLQIFLRFTNDVEYFYLNESGLIQTHVCVPNSFVSKLYLKLETEIIDKGKYRCSSTVCCWCKYEQSLSKLARSVLPSVLNFLKKPHTCGHYCTCCCKGCINISNKVAKFMPISLTRSAKYTNGAIKKKIQSIRGQQKNEVYTSIQEEQTGGQVTQSNPIHIDLTEMKSETSSVDTFDIYETFKDLKLNIEQKGEVTAVTSIRPNELSTKNLKILAHIISNAQKQIKQLGIMGTNMVIDNIFNKDPILLPQNIPSLLENRLTDKPATSKTSSVDNNTYSKSTTFVHNKKDLHVFNKKAQYQNYATIMGQKTEEYYISITALENNCTRPELRSSFENLTTYLDVEQKVGTRNKNINVTHINKIIPTVLKRKSNQGMSDCVNAKHPKRSERHQIQTQRVTVPSGVDVNQILENVKKSSTIKTTKFLQPITLHKPSTVTQAPQQSSNPVTNVTSLPSRLLQISGTALTLIPVTFMPTDQNINNQLLVNPGTSAIVDSNQTSLTPTVQQPINFLIAPKEVAIPAINSNIPTTTQIATKPIVIDVTNSPKLSTSNSTIIPNPKDTSEDPECVLGI